MKARPAILMQRSTQAGLKGKTVCHHMVQAAEMTQQDAVLHKHPAASCFHIVLPQQFAHASVSGILK